MRLSELNTESDDTKIARAAQELAQAELALRSNDLMNVATIPEDRQRQLADRARIKIRHATAVANYEALIAEIAQASPGQARKLIEMWSEHPAATECVGSMTAPDE